MTRAEVEQEAPVVLGQSLVGDLRPDRDRLSSVIAEGPLDVGRALYIAHQIATALANAHARGILHTNLHPHDVRLVDSDDEPDSVQVLDFDTDAADFEATSVQTPEALARLRAQGRRIFAAPAYLSPEQELGKRADARSDLYALGVVMFEMLTGTRPHEVEGKHLASSLKVMYDPPAMSTVRPDASIPDAVENLVQRLLEREPRERFQDARDVLDAIEACDEWAPRSGGRARPEAPARRRVWRMVRPFFVSDVLAGLAAGLILFFVGGALLRSPVTPDAAPPRSRRPVSSFYRPTLGGSGTEEQQPAQAVSEVPPPPSTQEPAVDESETKPAPSAPPSKPTTRKKTPPAIAPATVTDFGGRR
jgi:serine/threonine protein kinase